MRQATKSLLEKSRTSLWPIPTAIALASVALAWIAVRLDALEPVHRFTRQQFSVAPSVAETIMTTVAGSVISVGGVAFSVTMVAMTLASGQFGPKVLREFLDSPMAKITLGLLIGTFIYNILALISVRDAYGPGLYLVIGVGLAILTFFLFVHFVHSTALSIQADRIVQQIASQMKEALIDLADTADDDRRRQGSACWRRGASGRPVRALTAQRSGYVESIDYLALAATAQDAEAYFELKVRAGDFVLLGQTLLNVHAGAVPGEKLDGLVGRIRLASVRTPVQDPEFAVVQLNQIALRALSSGINDPATAINCIDWFSAALAPIVDRDLPNFCFADAEGEVRVIGRAVDFKSLFASVWLPLRQPAQGNVPVVLRLLEAMGSLAALTRRPDRLALIRRFATDLEAQTRRDAVSESDRDAVSARMRRVAAALGEPNP